MAEIVRIKKGLDIPLQGAAAGRIERDDNTRLFAIVPDDFPGYAWRLKVKPGDKVLKGSVLLTDKQHELICITAPVSGTVVEVRRGERRKIEAVVVEKDDADEQVPFDVADMDADKLKHLLCNCGLWAMMRQRPYDIIPSPTVEPRDIFITSFDSAPLAPDMLQPEQWPALENGIKALSTLTQGKVWLGVKFGAGISSPVAEVTEYQGPHPAGNVGVQIASQKPVNKGDVVWALDARTVARIGSLLADGTLDTSALVAITGPDVKDPCMVATTIGASIATLVCGRLKNEDSSVRVISGNVLTGIKVDIKDGWLRWPYRQITVIDEGSNADEFMGWASLNPKKFSVKRSFPAFLRGLDKTYDFDARIKGGHRSMILSGEYDKVFPMDIYPEFLLKAIMAKDIDRMEQLGIYEVAPEDFALAEFVDTSKLPLQQIVADGINYLRHELE